MRHLPRRGFRWFPGGAYMLHAIWSIAGVGQRVASMNTDTERREIASKDSIPKQTKKKGPSGNVTAAICNSWSYAISGSSPSFKDPSLAHLFVRLGSTGMTIITKSEESNDKQRQTEASDEIWGSFHVGFHSTYDRYSGWFYIRQPAVDDEVAVRG
ncbi:hypothetical protein B0H19DRAFT_1068249 [Mycena capillaripes]|nr:hypothetical protein B0H19DRAFT_1068249 [Mycena capillaripes]